MSPFLSLRFCWGNIRGRAWMSLGALHLQAACLGASFQRMFEHFIYRASTPSTAFLKLLSVSARKAIWKPHSRAVHLLLPQSSYGQVAAPGRGLAYLRSIHSPGGTVMCLCVFIRHAHWFPCGLQHRFPDAALRTGPGQQWHFNRPRRNEREKMRKQTLFVCICIWHIFNAYNILYT